MDRSWLKAWIVAAVLAVAMAAGYEGLLRSRQYAPAVEDDADLWAIQFDRIRADPRGVALLGTSRILFGIDPALLSELFGGRTVAMLAVNGKYPLAALRMLAEETDFAGLAVVGIDARGLSKRHWEMQRAYLAHYRDRWTLARRVHREIKSWLQERIVFLRAQFSPVKIVRRLLIGLSMPDDYAMMRTDRAGFLDFRRTDAAAVKARRLADLEAYYRENPPPTPEVWLRDLAEVSAWLRRIEARGGRVMLFCEPATKEYLDIHERGFPRLLYWDRYEREAQVEMVEFRDEPAFARFKLPDSEHIDGGDVAALTLELARVLEARGIVSPLSPQGMSVVPLM